MRFILLILCCCHLLTNGCRQQGENMMCNSFSMPKYNEAVRRLSILSPDVRLCAYNITKSLPNLRTILIYNWSGSCLSAQCLCRQPFNVFLERCGWFVIFLTRLCESRKNCFFFSNSSSSTTSSEKLDYMIDDDLDESYRTSTVSCRNFCIFIAI